MKPLLRRTLGVAALIAACALTTTTAFAASDGAPPKVALKHDDVTIRVFDPDGDRGNGQDDVLPVDSPDEEHAVASTLANAASFTKKTNGSSILPAAFRCLAVTARP